MNKNIILGLFIGATVVLAVVLITKNDKELNQTNNNSPTEQEKVVTKDLNVASSKTLDLSNQGLTELPKSALNNKSVTVLNISNNNITGALPAEIKELQNLKELNASNNNMTGVPAEVGQLTKLEVLNLSNNQLTGLPNELGNLKNLKVFNISGNNYSQQDLEIIKQSLPDSTKIIK